MFYKIFTVLILTAFTLSSATENFAQTSVPPDSYQWTKLKTEPFRGKQDDVFFITPDVGWYVNGSGKIYKTIDGGTTWTLKLNKPGTYFRSVGFASEQRGFAGNIGTEYYPNVTDTTPLYETSDGGETWQAVEAVNERMIRGICAIEIVKKPFINAGKLDYKTTVYAGGRVGGPTRLLKSEDGGATWQSIDLSRYCQMILDIKFFDAKNGIISAGSDAAVEKSNALILMTTDGGKTWSKRYQSNRPYELTWKSSFPTRRVGYVTVQNYNPDKKVSQRVIAKTTDGGKTWKEIPLVNDFNLREFGIGFIDKNRGWVGGSTGGYETLDGGKTWKSVEMGKAVNKIRLLKTENGFVGYAIGVDLYKLSVLENRKKR
ncbi:MAG: hypothetical protein M3388_17730 [Acidobacteriota bacterium]|nr:hypothetical protein [Acidobacteriota bacterium]